MFSIEEISLQNEKQIQMIKQFLKKYNLEFDNDIDYTIAVMEHHQLIATASKHRNVLKCFAIHEDYQGLGIVNTLVKSIEDRMFKEGLYHFFIYTLSHNKTKFESIGYREIICEENVCLLENGAYRIETYLNQLKSNYQVSSLAKACIIMNANPFTLGHRYLIEQASHENEEVLVFVVSEDQSDFPFSVRFQLVREGVKDLTNVKVIETGPYLVSNASFPTYFLKKKTDVVKIHANLDCQIFLKYYKPIFNLSVRYVGNEPYCEVTNLYNEVMNELLPKNGVRVKMIDRIEVNHEVISASRVRLLLKERDYDKLKSLVPQVTYNYLTSRSPSWKY